MITKPANIKGANKDDDLLFCIHTLCMNHIMKTILLVSSSVSGKQLLCFVHGQVQNLGEQNDLLFCIHTLCMTHIMKTILLVSSSVSGNQLLCFVHGQVQKREQNHTTKNFVRFHNYSPLLTMMYPFDA